MTLKTYETSFKEKLNDKNSKYFWNAGNIKSLSFTNNKKVYNYVKEHLK